MVPIFVVAAPFEVGSDVFLYGYLSNPSVFHVNFFPYSSIAPLLEKLAVVIVPIVNNKVSHLLVFSNLLLAAIVVYFIAGLCEL